MLMLMRATPILLLSLVLVLDLLPSPRLLADEKSEDDAIIALGREHTRLFFEKKTEELWAKLGPDLKKAFGARATLDGFHAQVRNQVGEEKKVITEKVMATGGMKIYLRYAMFTKFAQPIIVSFSYDKTGEIAGFSITPEQKAAPSRFLDYETKTELRLPFEGEWMVFWGGRTIAENYHAAVPDQRFAYDLLIMKDGKSHEGDGTKNEQYYCFGQKVVSPGAGSVVAMVNDVEDNVPGKMNPLQALGNHVILDHGNGEFSFLAHFKKGTVTVKKGDKVESGQLLGLCGNSGNSTEAHIHYHLQNTPKFNQGEGLPVWFRGYTADGKFVEKGEPRKGEVIGPGKKKEKNM